jgi:hypothetical protein
MKICDAGRYRTVCVEDRVKMEEKHVKAQYQSISALGLKQVQSAYYMRSAVACQMQHCQYM